MKEDIDRKKSFLINFAYALVLIAIYYVFCRYVIYALMPFMIAVLIMLLLRKPAAWCTEKLHVPRKAASAVLVVLLYGVGGFVLVRIVMLIAGAVGEWFAGFPDLYSRSIAPAVRQVLNWFNGGISFVDPELQDELSQISANVMSGLSSIVSDASSAVVSLGGGVVSGIPGALIGILFGVISSFFFTMDYPRISYFVNAQISDKTRDFISGAFRFKNGASVGKLLLSYIAIMCITFVELNIGFLILGIDNQLTVALIIAIFDILPVVGSGTVLIPWAFIALVQGRLKMAIGLVLLYVIITFIRNMIEPKLVGQTLGLHPVLMLVSIYLGVTLLGPLGIFILPLTLIVIRNLNDGGYIHLYNSAYMPHTEAPSAAEKAAELAAEKVEAVIQKAKKDTGDE